MRRFHSIEEYIDFLFMAAFAFITTAILVGVIVAVIVGAGWVFLKALGL